MNTLTNTAIAAAMVIAIAAPASASVTAEIGRSVNSAAGSGSNVFVQVRGDTVILNGYVEDNYARRSIERAAAKSGAARVINRVVVSD